MNRIIKDYYEQIKALPLKTSYIKEELLIPEFFVEGEKDIELYYCTRNEHINPNAKIFIVGITPGFNQMNKSIVMARKCIEKGIPLDEIPFATFVKGKNYTGHQPNLLKNELLMKYVRKHFYPQIDILKDALIIPLGRCVEEVLGILINEGRIREEQCLMGFPHPSGANAHRMIQFRENREILREKIREY